MKILDVVKDDNIATFSFYRNGNMFYNVQVEGNSYSFPIPLVVEDIGTATLPATEKAITLMRYIRKALADGTFVRA